MPEAKKEAAKPSQQDIIEKVKAEAEAKKAQASAEKKPEKAKAANEDLPDEDPDEALAKMEAEAAASEAKMDLNEEQQRVVDGIRDSIINSKDGANADDEAATVDRRPFFGVGQAAVNRESAAKAAHDKLRRIALDFHPNDPDEHVIFGRAGIKYTIGDLRDLLMLR